MLIPNFVDRVQQYSLSHMPRLQFVILSSKLLVTLQNPVDILSMKIFYVFIGCLGAQLLTLFIFSSLYFVIFKAFGGRRGRDN